MKRVLIIAYLFPPCPEIGAQRPYKLAKYLPSFGWEPVILTAKLPGEKPEGFRVIETDYKDVVNTIKSRIVSNPKKTLHEQLGISVTKNFNHTTWKSRLIKIVRETIAYPDDKRGWFKYAVKSASEFLDNEKVDAIISTSSPVTSHLIAKKLKQKYRIPWIADLRDLWTQNPYHNKFSLINFFERRLEIKTLSEVDAIVTVAFPWIDTFKILHKNKKIFCVTNGFDKDDFPKLPSKLTRKFTITYTGILYNGKRDPSLLFEVLAELNKDNRINRDLIEIRFYGPKEEWLLVDIKRYNLEGVVGFYGFVPRKEALDRQKESQILLLLLWNNKNEEGFCPAKLYEYFGAGRPIIAIGRRGHIVEGLLGTTNAGKYICDHDTLKSVLLEYYREFVNSGEVKCYSNSNIENYTYKSVTERYSDVLDYCSY